MKAKLLVLTLAAVLSSCAAKSNNGTKVDRAKFIEECKKIEAHTYARATVKMKGTMKDGDNVTNMDYEFKFVWNSLTTSFDFDPEHVPSDTQEYYAGQQCKSQISYTLIEIAAMYEADPTPTPEGDTYEFYINPFRVVADTHSTYVDNKSESKYNKYGYIVSLKSKVTAKATGEVSEYTATATYADA